MSRSSFSEQDLFARFQQLNEEMPQDVALRIERKVLAEVAVTLRPNKTAAAAPSRGLFAQLIDRIPNWQLSPSSYAMAGAMAVVLLVVLVFSNPFSGLLGLLPSSNETGRSSNDPAITLDTSTPTDVPTDTPTEIPTATPVTLAVDEGAQGPTAVPTETSMPAVPEATATATDTTEPTSIDVVSPTTVSAQGNDNQQTPLIGDGASEASAPVISGTEETESEEGRGTSFGPTATNTPIPTLTSTSTGASDVVQSNPTQQIYVSPVLSPKEEENSVAFISATPTNTQVPTATNTPTATSTDTINSVNNVGAPTSTSTPVPPTNTATPTDTPTLTNTPTNTPTSTFIQGSTQQSTNTPLPTVMPTKTAAPTVAPITITPSRTATATPAIKATSTSNSTVGGIVVPTNTPSTVQVTPTVVNTDTPQPTVTDTNTPQPTVTDTNTPVPTATVNQPPQAEDYTVNVAEDGILSFNLLSDKISDPENGALSIQIVKEPDSGQLTVIDDNFMANYVPIPNYTGQDTVLLQVTDSGGLHARATITIVVSPVNDVPVANLDRVRVDEDDSIVVDVLKNDTDPDVGDTLEIVNVTIAQAGTATIDAGQIKYVPAPNFVGQDAFSYQIWDGTAFDSAVVEVEVLPIQDEPSPQIDNIDVNEDSSVDIPVLVNDIDIDEDPLRITRVEPLTGTAEIIQNETMLRFTPVTDAYGIVSFRYFMTDGTSEVASTVNVNILPVPDAPVAVDDVENIDEDAQVTISPIANDTDVDGEGDVLTLTQIVSAPKNGTASIGPGNTINYTPRRDFNGPDFFEYEVTDSSGLTDKGLITVNVTSFNDKPEAVAEQPVTQEDTPILIPVLANDRDPDGDILEIESFTAPANGTVAIEGNALLYTPKPDFNGPDPFTYTATDGRESATATVQLQVIAQPDLPKLETDSVTGDEDTAIRILVLINDHDVDGDSLTVVSVSVPAAGSATIENGDTVLYQPNPNFAGKDSFVYTVSDGTYQQQATVDVTVRNINDLPNGQADEIVLQEDTEGQVDVLLNDTDADNDLLTITNISQPAHASVEIVDNKVRVVPEANFAGKDVALVTITDGSAEIVTELIINVVEVPDAPAANDDVASGQEDKPLTIDVLLNDRDADPGTVLTIAGISTPISGSIVSLVDNKIHMVPPANYSGTEVFNYTISDNQGNQETATVTVKLDPVNDPPVAEDDVAEIDAGVSEHSFNVRQNDRDIDNDTEWWNLRILGIAMVQPNGGTAFIRDNQIVYTPAEGFSGIVTINYIVFDGELSDEGQLTITVKPPPNVPPTAVDDQVDTIESTLVVAPVLANDSDLDNRPQPLSIQIVGLPTNGTALVVNNEIHYTPNPGFVGADSLTYEASDGQLVDPAILTIVVSKVDQPPTPGDDTATTDIDTQVVINALANDSDPDADPVTITAVGIPSNGTATLTQEQRILYLPNPGFVGTDTFSYTVTANGISRQANVVVTVIAPAKQTANQPPTAASDTAIVNAGEAVTIHVLSNDTDPEGSALVIQSVSSPSNGIATINGATIVFTPSATYSGTVTIDYTISDGELSATSTISVSVNTP
ncbi:MAG: Ig-like domain-containing protein [Chloroflexota bacterium]